MKDQIAAVQARNKPDHSNLQRLLAEFTGTGFLLSVVIGSAIMAHNHMGGNAGLELMANAVATGAALSALILMFGPISGAHFNPAVSFAFWLRGELSGRLLMAYFAVQIAGGLTGVLIAHVMFNEPIFQISQTGRAGIGQWTGEAVATFALLGAILGLLKRSPQAIPYAVGLVIVAGYWYTSSTSFANPAVTIARMFTQSPPGIQPSDAVPLYRRPVAHSRPNRLLLAVHGRQPVVNAKLCH